MIKVIQKLVDEINTLNIQDTKAIIIEDTLPYISIRYLNKPVAKIVWMIDEQQFVGECVVYGNHPQFWQKNGIRFSGIKNLLCCVKRHMKRIIEEWPTWKNNEHLRVERLRKCRKKREEIQAIFADKYEPLPGFTWKSVIKDISVKEDNNSLVIRFNYKKTSIDELIELLETSLGRKLLNLQKNKKQLRRERLASI